MWCVSSTKGGVGCSVVSAAIGLLAARTRPTLLVDFGGDLPAVLGLESDDAEGEGEGHRGSTASGLGLVDWLATERPPPDALGRLERSVGGRLHGRLSLLPTGTVIDPPTPHGGDRLEILAGLLAGEGRLVIVDLGTAVARYRPLLDRAASSIHVTRSCYLALRRPPPRQRCDRVVLVRERGRVFTPSDASRALGVPISASIEVDPAVARAVDAGLLTTRFPRSLRSLDVLLPPDPARTSRRAVEPGRR